MIEIGSVRFAPRSNINSDRITIELKIVNYLEILYCMNTLAHIFRVVHSNFEWIKNPFTKLIKNHFQPPLTKPSLGKLKH